MKYLQKLKTLSQELADYQVPLYAANASFYFILAFFPTIMLLVCLVPLIGYSQADLLTMVNGVVPSVLHPLIERIIGDLSSNSTEILLSITAVTAIWSASRSVYCIQLGLNAIHRVKENRSYFLRRLLSVVYMVFVIIALLLTILLHGFGREVTAFFESKSIPVLHFLVRILRFRGLILLGLLTLFFTAFYCLLPNKRIKIRYAFPGAIAAALGWLVFTYFFSYYVKYSGSYSVIYGSLAIIAISMLWLFTCMCILFYGAVLNIHIEKWCATE